MIKMHNKEGLTDINIHSENFFCYILNRVYEWGLDNKNHVAMNFPSIDLAGSEIAVQVTSTTTRKKIVKTLEKFHKNGFDSTYNRLVILQLSDSKKYRKPSTLNALVEIEFDASDDIIDIQKLLEDINKKGVKDKELFNDLISYFESEIPSLKRVLTKNGSLLSDHEEPVGKAPETLCAYSKVLKYEDNNLPEDLKALKMLQLELNNLVNDHIREALYLLMRHAESGGNETELKISSSTMIELVFNGDKNRASELSRVLSDKGFIHDWYYDSHEPYILGWYDPELGHNWLWEIRSYAEKLEQEFGLPCKDTMKQVVINCDFSVFDTLPSQLKE